MKEPFFIRQANTAFFGVDGLGRLLHQAGDVAHPRMRPATRPGWKSPARQLSPTPTSLIGAPVTARIDSAAPPLTVAVHAGEDEASDATGP